MAEQKEEKSSSKGGRFPLKTVIIIAIILLVEVGTVAVAYWVAAGPAEVKADGAALDEAALAEQPVEMLVVEDKFQNTRTGRPYLYDTEIYIVVARKHSEKVSQDLTNMQAQITTNIATVFRRAEPAHLLEPELSTLTRQIKAVLDQHLGYDDDGEPYVREVLIRKCTQFRADL